jgi:hypothetical protein
MCSPREAERHWVSLLTGSPTAQAVLKFDVGLLSPLSHCEYRARIAGPLFAVGLRIQVVSSNEEKVGLLVEYLATPHFQRMLGPLR